VQSAFSATAGLSVVTTVVTKFAPKLLCCCVAFRVCQSRRTRLIKLLTYSRTCLGRCQCGRDFYYGQGRKSAAPLPGAHIEVKCSVQYWIYTLLHLD